MDRKESIQKILDTPVNSVVERFVALALAQPEHLCFADCEGDMNYDEALRTAMGMADRLKAAGIGKDDKVCVSCTQDRFYALSEYAIHLAGGVVVPIEKGAADIRIAEIIRVSDAKMYIGDKPVEIGEERDKCAACDRTESCTKKLPYIFTTLAEMCSQPYQGEIRIDDLALPEREDTSELLFSTGTTGKSKGIEMSHGNDVALCENVISGTHMEPDTNELILMPISHSHGLRRYNANIYNGSSSTFLYSVMKIKDLFRLLDTYGCNALDMSPAILEVIFKMSKDKIGDYRDQIRYLQTASAPLSEEAKHHLVRVLPNTRMYNFYGCTEAGCTITDDFRGLLERPGAMGYSTANAEIVFLDENKNVVEHPTLEHPAYISTGGAQNMKGYWKEPELTAEAVYKGYVVSKDLGYIEEDGMIFFIGRDDDVINAGGIKISPVEIEAEVMKYPGIKECACVPLKDPVQGEIPKLFYVLEEGVELDLKDFKNFLRENIDANKVPGKLEEIEALPRTYNGKIQRKKLTGRYGDRLM